MIIDFIPSARLDRAVARSANNPDGVGLREMLLAAQAKRISLTAILNRRARWSPRDLKTRLPTIVLIGDDLGDSRDPDQWRCCISVLAWARSAIVHGTGADPLHYRTGVTLAEATGRHVFVETDSSHIGPWVEALAPRSIPVVIFQPPPGTGPHPSAHSATVGDWA